MKCIAIDDEPIALSIINSYCNKYSEIELITFTNPLLGISYILKEKPEVVFMDIEMNEYSGLELARQLPEETILVFTTAHANYALNGYEVHAIDFLHKPFSPERFDATISRVKQIIEIRNKARAVINSPESQITIKVAYQNVTIPTGSISYIEGMDNYIKIHLDNKKTIITKMSIKCFMELLTEKEFIRVHKSFIVAKSMIISYTKQQLRILNYNNISIPIGRNYSESLFKVMNNNDF